MRRKTMVVVAALAAAFAAATSAEAPAPPAPPASVPDITTTNPAILCVDCDHQFDIPIHNKILNGLVSNPYIGELRKALYTQDTYHQFQSKAHFDNCDFEGATTYISELFDETGRYVEVATKAKAAGNTPALKKAVLSAFFSLGQALHATQDFYAHTNYVELQAPKVKKVTDIELVFPWRAEGRARIKELQGAGMISGFVFWGVPQKCPSGSISHANLAKDSANTKSGKAIVTSLNLSQYRIAVYLAREASLELLTDAFKRWPLLKEVNGESVAIEVLVDRRGLDKP